MRMSHGQSKSIRTYHKYIDLKSLLEKVLGRRVDLLTPPALEPRLKENVLKNLIDVTE